MAVSCFCFFRLNCDQIYLCAPSVASLPHPSLSATPCTLDKLSRATANNRLFPPLPIQICDVARIYMRRKYEDIRAIVGNGRETEFGERALELRWKCPHCEFAHPVYIPEAWIDEGLAEFVAQEE